MHLKGKSGNLRTGKAYQLHNWPVGTLAKPIQGIKIICHKLSRRLLVIFHANHNELFLCRFEMIFFKRISQNVCYCLSNILQFEKLTSDVLFAFGV